MPLQIAGALAWWFSSKILLTLNLKKMLNFNDRDNSYLQSICEFLQEYPNKADSKQFFKVFGQC